MTLKALLVQKKAAVLDRWRDLIIQMYPANTTEFVKRCNDRFNNPVGHAIVRETESIYDTLLEGSPNSLSSSSFDDIVKIRSVQDFSPSQSVVFVFLLKKAIREQVATELQQDAIAAELLSLESRIDELALHTFDAYMRCREKIHEIRVNEIKNRTLKLLDRINPAADEAPKQCREILGSSVAKRMGR